MSRPTGGYVKLHRSIAESWLSDDPIAAWMFCLLIMWANWDESAQPLRKQRIKLARGQVATSDKELATKLKIDRKTVRRKIRDMQMDRMLDISRDNCGSIITILNYDLYQDEPSKVGTAVGTSKGTTGGTTEGTTGGTHQKNSRTQELKNSSSANFAPQSGRGKKGGEASFARATVAQAVGILRTQASAGIDPRKGEAEAFASLGAERAALLRLKYPTWSQFAVHWLDQRERGFEQVFEKELRADLRSLAASPPKASDSDAGAS